ncbi:hypothetical protein EG834_10355 [bacterium]|nr:hypothetical protein [bacterium]
MTASIIGGDRLFPKTYNAIPQDIVAALNDGRVALFYNGNSLGTPTTFKWATETLLTADQVLALESPAVPLVAAFAPNTANFNASPSMADAWMLNPSSGALTYIGATAENYDDTNLDLVKWVFEGLFSNYAAPLSVGEAFQTGMRSLADNTGYELTYYPTYLLFGDPSLTIRFPEGPLLTAPFSYVVTNMGSTLTIPFTIKNVGPSEADFSIEAHSDWGVPLTLSPSISSITLASGESTVIRVAIQIKDHYEVRDRDTIRFTVMQIDPPNDLLTAKLNVSFQIFEPSVFLPIINR